MTDYRQLTITEYFARLVTAGLASDWENVWTCGNQYSNYMEISNNSNMENAISVINVEYTTDTPLQLRKDGIDLYELEWRKPTERDIGKMCWFMDDYDCLCRKELEKVEIDDDVEFGEKSRLFYIFVDVVGYYSQNCLLADHGQIAPKVKDFERIYNDRL